MAAYCSVADVMGVLRLFDTDVDDIQTITEEQISAIITEASEEVQYIVAAKYDLAVVNALDPVPLALNYLAKYKSAVVALERLGPVSSDRNQKLQEFILKEYETWKHHVTFGLLLDSTQQQVPGRGVVTQAVLNQSFPDGVRATQNPGYVHQFRRYA